MKKSVPSPNLRDAVFVYTSQCCQAPATKPALTTERGQRIGSFGSSPKGAGTLGSWRCTNCRRPCSVTRQIKPAKDTQ